MDVDSGQYGGVILSGFIAVSMHHIMQSQLGSWACYHCWLMRVTDLLFSPHAASFLAYRFASSESSAISLERLLVKVM